MRILLAHNYYLQRGGEDVVLEGERELLRRKGHTVVEFLRRNSSINEQGRVATAVSAIWSLRARKELGRVLRSENIDVAHFHNTFPLLSPSVYSACHDAGVPVVQTLHNYRWLCPAATFYRDGGICEECLDKSLPYPSVVHACYHGSRPQSLIVAGMLAVHRYARTLQKLVSVFVAPTEFLKDMFVQNGFSPGQIMVKPYFVSPDPGEREAAGDYALFLGRLSEEKGIRTLLKAWASLASIPLKIAGDGPLSGEVEKYLGSNPDRLVQAMGYQKNCEVMPLLKKSLFLVVPSDCYEVLPNVILEAFACGVPVVVPSHGALRKIVRDGINGLHFAPGDGVDLAKKVAWAYEHPQELLQMGKNNRREYEDRYTADRNYEMLFEIYRKAILKLGKTV